MSSLPYTIETHLSFKTHSNSQELDKFARKKLLFYNTPYQIVNNLIQFIVDKRKLQLRFIIGRKYAKMQINKSCIYVTHSVEQRYTDVFSAVTGLDCYNVVVTATYESLFLPEVLKVDISTNCNLLVPPLKHQHENLIT